MKKTKLKSLAIFSVKSGSIDKKTADFVLKRLKRKDLKIYLRYLKDEIVRNTVIVKSSLRATTNIKKRMGEIFPEKKIKYIFDDSVEGLKVIDKDNIIDLSVKNYIHESIKTIKNSL